jgi:hypothetical protein
MQEFDSDWAGWLLLNWQLLRAGLINFTALSTGYSATANAFPVHHKSMSLLH